MSDDGIVVGRGKDTAKLDMEDAARGTQGRFKLGLGPKPESAIFR